jgi:hypothetical protein
MQAAKMKVLSHLTAGLLLLCAVSQAGMNQINSAFHAAPQLSVCVALDATCLVWGSFCSAAPNESLASDTTPKAHKTL